MGGIISLDILNKILGGKSISLCKKKKKYLEYIKNTHYSIVRKKPPNKKWTEGINNQFIK